MVRREDKATSSDVAKAENEKASISQLRAQ
jgi:hypothetical protein